jgi:pyridoxamine 5'-phosphate oxidase
MPKVSQLSSDPAVEIAWWIEDPAIQFRIGGNAYVIPASNPSTEGQIKSTLQAIGAKGDEADPAWWENKREELWNKSISGHLRASFARPTPGQSLKTIDRQPEEWDESIPAQSVR